MTEKQVSRRGFLGVAAAAVVAGVVCGVGGYYGGVMSAPSGKATTTVTTSTVTSPATTVTSPPVTTTVTSAPVTTTVSGGTPPPPLSRDYILIGGVVGLTGPIAMLGTNSQWAYQQVESDWNNRGGVYVREYNRYLPVKIIIYDDQGDTGKNISAVTRLATVDQVDFMIGGGGPQTLPCLTQQIKFGSFVVGGAMSTRTIWNIGYKYLFSSFLKAYECILTVQNWSIKQPQPPIKTVASMEVDADQGADAANAVDENQTALGYKTVFRQKYVSNAQDYTDYILKLKVADADLVTGYASPTDFLTVMNQSKELNYTARAYQMVQAPEAWQWGSIAGRTGEYVTTPMPWNQDFPTGQNINKAFIAKFGFPPFAHVPTFYQSIDALLEAITLAGTFTDKDALRQIYLTNTFRTSVGDLKFLPNGSGDVPHAIVQWQYKGGQMQRLTAWVQEHPDWATTNFEYPAPAWKDRTS